MHAINILSVRFFLKIENLIVDKNHISLFYVLLQYTVLHKRRLRDFYNQWNENKVTWWNGGQSRKSNQTVYLLIQYAGVARIGRQVAE